MPHKIRNTAVAALCCAAVGAGLVASAESAGAQTPQQPVSAANAAHVTNAKKAGAGLLSGTKKIRVQGRSVNVSCSGRSVAGRPVVVLMAGLGDGLKEMAGLRETLSEQGKVCSYDRLGEGDSDQPAGPQTIARSGKVLTGVLNRVAGHGPVVLAGHSLGGLIAAEYAPDHRDRVKGLVLMDATSPTTTADIKKVIPESATGMPGDLRAQTVAVMRGQNQEKLVAPDTRVRSAGRIPVEVIQHGGDYLSSGVPVYGPAIQQVWADGQHKWLALSCHSKPTTAANSGHYIYVDRPDIAIHAIQRVTARATR